MSFRQRLSTLGLASLAVLAIACDGHSVIGQQDGKGGGGGSSPGTAGGGGGGVAGSGGSGPGVGGTTGAAGTGPAGASGVAGSGGACAQSTGGASGSGVAFASLLHYATPSPPFSLALGDLDGDAKLDFAASSYYDDGISGGGGSSGTGEGNLSVFLSSEHYVVVHGYHAGNGSQAIAIGDLDGDGAADVASVVAGEVNVLFNAGGGTLQPAVSFSVGTNPTGVALGDLNGDGRTDMVVANRGYGSGDPLGTFIAADVAVLISLGGGNFAAANYPAGTSPVAVALGDLNGDGSLDLAVASGRGVSVLLNGGAGTFGAAASYGAGTNPNTIAIGDLNGDGKPDLVVGDPSLGGASVLLNVGSGTFAAAVNYAYRGQYGWPYSIALGDLNGDCKPDLASTSSLDAIAFLPNAGRGTLGAAVPVFAGASPTSVAIGDLNGDGKLDVFVTMQDGVGVLQNAR